MFWSVFEGSRRFEEVQESRRRSEKVRDSRRKSERVWRKSEKGVEKVGGVEKTLYFQLIFEESSKSSIFH